MWVLDRIARLQQGAAAAIAVLGAATWSQPSVAGSDLWWHLASGREIWRRGKVPLVDPYSFTFGGQPWTNHEWLWDVLYWSFYRLHPEAVAWLNLAIVTAVFALAFRVAWRASGSILAAGASLWLVAAASHWFIDIRPHLFTLLFSGLVLVTRERRWAVWLWPPLTLIWVNLHGGFVFGVGLIGLFVLVNTIEASLRARRVEIPWRQWVSVAACLFAIVLNPYSAEVLAYPLAYLDTASPYRTLVEWHPPPLDLDPARFSGRFWILAGVFVLGLPLALRRAPYLAVLGLVTLSMAVTARRFIPLFGVTAAPVAAMALGWLQARVTERWRTLETPGAGLAATALAAALTVWLWSGVRLWPSLLYRWTEGAFYPEAALRYADALDRPLRVFNYYNWGGFIHLHLPKLQVYIDGRANTLYDDQTYADYNRIAGGRQGFRPLLRRAGAEAVLVPNGSALGRALQGGSRPWQTIYVDRLSILLVPPDSPILAGSLPDADVLLDDHPERLLTRARRALATGREAEALEWLEEALKRNPLLVAAYAEIARIHAQRGDIAAIRRTVERGLRADPRQATRLRAFESTCYQIAGDLPRAIQALRQAIPRGPFRSPEGVLRRIEALEARQAAAREGRRGEGR